jgi:hypothetical protein
MIEQTFVLTVRDCPKSINAGGGGTRANPYAAAKEKKKWQGTFGTELLAARVRRGMQFCNVYVTVRFKHKGGGKGRDEENFRQPVIKPLLDALTAGGYLEDDTDEYVKVKEFELVDGVKTWPYADPRLKAEIIIKLEGSYL